MDETSRSMAMDEHRLEVATSAPSCGGLPVSRQVLLKSLGAMETAGAEEACLSCVAATAHEPRLGPGGAKTETTRFLIE